MKTAEFKTEITPNGQIGVPSEMAVRVPRGEQVDAILQWGASEDDSSWRMARRRPC